MLEHTTIEILKSFSQDEIGRLTNFIESPYFNKSKKIHSFYKEIIKFYPGFSHKKFTREYFGKFINKHSEYKDSELRDYLSKLLSLVREFLILERLNIRKDLKSLLALNELSDRDFDDLYEKYNSVLQEDIESRGCEAGSFLVRYHSFNQNYNNQIINKKVKKSIHAESEVSEMIGCAHNLTSYNLVTIISIYSNLITQEKKFNLVSKETTYLSNIIQSLEGHINDISCSSREKLLIELYLQLYNAFRNFDDARFYTEYKNDLVSKEKYLSYEEIKFHNARLIGYSIIQKKYQSNTATWNKELFDLYKNFLKQKFYLSRHENNLSHNLFRDIMINAINVNELDWLNKFIEEYSDSLHIKFKDNMKKYALAFLAFKKQQFSKSIEIISDIDLDYFIYKYDIRNLKLVNYFELGEIVGIVDLIHAYEEGLRKDRLVGQESKAIYKNFIYYLKKLIRFSNNKKELTYYNSKLLNESKLTYKNWLKEKYLISIGS